MADMLTARRPPAPPAPAVPSTFTFDAIGTRWCIDTDEPLNGEVRDRILNRILTSTLATQPQKGTGGIWCEQP
jgi:hypothetical protein